MNDAVVPLPPPPPLGPHPNPYVLYEGLGRRSPHRNASHEPDVQEPRDLPDPPQDGPEDSAHPLPVPPPLEPVPIPIHLPNPNNNRPSPIPIPDSNLLSPVSGHAHDHDPALLSPHSSPGSTSSSLPDLSSSPTGSSSSIPDLAECGVCASELERFERAIIPGCKHVFCFDCVRGYVIARLEEGKLDMPCPGCVAERGSTRGRERGGRKEEGEISRDFIEFLELSRLERDTLERLELAEYAVLHRCAKCSESVYIDRQEYLSNSFIDCPLPNCHGRSCKDCGKVVPRPPPPEDATPEYQGIVEPHFCSADDLKNYLQTTGAKRCPGCATPILRNEGCNHMTCVVPGCHTHFCYKCSTKIISSKDSNAVRTAVYDHFHSGGCRLFT
ncbi:hypothetical protein DL93DRAFT_2067651 [Clavulina sp. PMI_390]|nr:hypothetical protein DL93DRAFT_2067651 [Clavulina sp. PMI_390]